MAASMARLRATTASAPIVDPLPITSSQPYPGSRCTGREPIAWFLFSGYRAARLVARGQTSRDRESGAILGRPCGCGRIHLPGRPDRGQRRHPVLVLRLCPAHLPGVRAPPGPRLAAGPGPAGRRASTAGSAAARPCPRVRRRSRRQHAGVPLAPHRRAPRSVPCRSRGRPIGRGRETPPGRRCRHRDSMRRRRGGPLGNDRALVRARTGGRSSTDLRPALTTSPVAAATSRAKAVTWGPSAGAATPRVRKA